MDYRAGDRGEQFDHYEMGRFAIDSAQEQERERLLVSSVLGEAAPKISQAQNEWLAINEEIVLAWFWIPLSRLSWRGSFFNFIYYNDTFQLITSFSSPLLFFIHYCLLLTLSTFSG